MCKSFSNLKGNSIRKRWQVLAINSVLDSLQQQSCIGSTRISYSLLQPSKSLRDIKKQCTMFAFHNL